MVVVVPPDPGGDWASSCFHPCLYRILSLRSHVFDPGLTLKSPTTSFLGVTFCLDVTCAVNPSWLFMLNPFQVLVKYFLLLILKGL